MMMYHTPGILWTSKDVERARESGRGHEALTLGEVGRRRRQGRVWGAPVVHLEGHRQPPRKMHVQVAMEEPYARVVGGEPNHGPSSDWHGDGVPDLGVVVIELVTGGGGVVVAETLSQDVEVEAVQVHGVTLHANQGRVLEDYLDRGVELQLLYARALQCYSKRAQADAWVSVVERKWRLVREVCCVDTRDVVVVGL
ncbi:hypothetical protein MLD38_038420 [Melastoma candidum]|uniref:Uncharacterized protein n=1 Tax=Melastoma candidum TaxID=119954 RepID=A0ACB9KZ50_9MYRT|nr:hypothetical protein MLD38_038420 [Melastoma candidum]